MQLRSSTKSTVASFKTSTLEEAAAETGGCSAPLILHCGVKLIYITATHHQTVAVMDSILYGVKIYGQFFSEPNGSPHERVSWEFISLCKTHVLCSGFFSTQSPPPLPVDKEM